MHDYHPAVSPESWLASSERPLLKRIRQIVRSAPGYPPRGPRWPATGRATQAATGSRTQGHAYFVYINIRSFQGAWRYAAESDWRLALGLRTAAIGILIGMIASLCRSVFVVYRWLGGAQVPWVNSVAGTMIGVSGTMLLGGLLLGAVLTGLARARTWWAHRSAWRALRPLWQVLQNTHRVGQLEVQAASPGRERWQLARMHRRYWRRYVETRDALVQLSPYLARAGYRPGVSDDQQVATLREALRIRAADDPPAEQEAVLVAPSAADSTTDVDQLLTLSRALPADMRER